MDFSGAFQPFCRDDDMSPHDKVQRAKGYILQQLRDIGVKDYHVQNVDRDIQDIIDFLSKHQTRL